jgi:hypothetical protein
MSEGKPIPPLEWLDKRVESTLEMKGQISAFYNQSKGQKLFMGEESANSWIDYLVEELLQVFRILRTHQRNLERMEQSQERLLKLLGLSPDASEQEIMDAIDDIAPLFADHRRKKRGT